MFISWTYKLKFEIQMSLKALIEHHGKSKKQRKEKKSDILGQSLTWVAFPFNYAFLFIYQLQPDEKAWK
jgi:hypothetical protein